MAYQSLGKKKDGSGNQIKKMAKQVLFVCIFNQSRSLIAELFLREMIRNQGDAALSDVTVASAGLLDPESRRWFNSCGVTLPDPLFNKPASPATRVLLSKRGIDISHHRSREVNKEMLDNSDVVIPVEKSLKRGIVSLYPEVEPKVFLPRELVNQELSFIWEDSNQIPLDSSLLDFIDNDIDYTAECARQLEEFLHQAWPQISLLLN